MNHVQKAYKKLTPNSTPEQIVGVLDMINSQQYTIKNKMDALQTEFNSVTIEMSNAAQQKLSTFVGVYFSNKVAEAIRDKPAEPISKFIIHIYMNDNYRTNIAAKNEEFFLNNTYDEVVVEEKENLIQQLKQHWASFDSKFKEYVKDRLAHSITISKDYVAYKCDMADLNKIKKTMIIDYNLYT